jgi:hypothetical protein
MSQVLKKRPAPSKLGSNDDERELKKIELPNIDDVIEKLDAEDGIQKRRAIVNQMQKRKAVQESRRCGC